MYALSGSINDINDSILRATIPIALRQKKSSRSEVIGSGVLVNVHGEIVLLTAAHVIDREADGDLLIPGRKYFTPLSGDFFKSKPPSSGRREDDKFDIGYVCLDKRPRQNLHSDCKILQRSDASLESDGKPKLCTLAGFPWRKTVSKQGMIGTEFTTLRDLSKRFGIQRAWIFKRLSPRC